MADSVRLEGPHIFTQVGIRFIRNDGSTSDVLSGSHAVISSKGQAISLVIRDGKLVIILVFFSFVWVYFRREKRLLKSYSIYYENFA